ncbi:ATP-binding cassette sub- D member 1 [Sarracenia purpurea var. burkii]
MVYYKISHVDGRITNPEQRIASDVPRFCSELSDLVQEDLTAVTDVLLYSSRLNSYASPKYIFWILAYVLGAGTVMRIFSPSFGKLMSKEQQLEGEYRQVHSRLRTHAESIAFYGGETREESHIQEKFKTLVRHMSVVLHEHWWFGMIQDFLLKYLGATVAVILIIEPFFSGDLRPDTSTLGRADMLSNLRYHTSVIISLFQSLGTLAISSRRLNRLRELIVQDSTCLQRNGSRNYVSEANYIEFDNVKVVTPTGNVLVEDLSLRVESGSNLLITGPNGSGKSSLFRVLGGLWPLVSGHIVKPGVGSDLNKEIFYVPQLPYTAVGTLRDQLIYPLTSDQEVEPLTHDTMLELLKNVDLEYLLERYPPEMEINWGDELSLGEQQRLGMARLFYHKPKFAILDECTSAVTTDMEERFCAKVRAMGTSCITISHRPALMAFHDVVLSLDGEGGWSVYYKRGDSRYLSEADVNTMKLSETERQSGAIAVQRAFANTKKDSSFSNAKSQSYISELIASSPVVDHDVPLPAVPQLRIVPRLLSLRVASMFKILIPTVLDKQGVQLLAVAVLVISRTSISDRIASLNGTTVKYVLEQNKAAFIRLIGISVLQSVASSIVAPSLRLALGWRIRLTQHLQENYLRNNAFYKMSSMNIDADQRITQDVEKLTTDLSGLVTGMVKPSVDILWFTWRMKMLTGRRGIAILYAYMLLGLGFLRRVAPDFGDLASQEQQLEGNFSGALCDEQMVESRFLDLLDHSKLLLKKKWLFGVLDDFITKQLPHNVTWALSLLYVVEHKGDRSLTSTQGDFQYKYCWSWRENNSFLNKMKVACFVLGLFSGELAHALRFLASVVSQSFLAFGDILELNRKFLELSGGINRVFELEELLDVAQKDDPVAFAESPTQSTESPSNDIISFSKVDIISPAQKMLARKLTCDILPGKSLLVTGPNGSGKSSVFRVLRGLWPNVSGRIVKPCQHLDGETGSSCGIFYISQRPFTCLGNLRDQIIYPLSLKEAEERTLALYGKGQTSGHATNILDAHLKTILENVKLLYLLEREGSWNTSQNWEDTLSLGEQQRLGMRPALIPFHSMELRLIDGEGNWELHSIKQ